MMKLPNLQMVVEWRVGLLGSLIVFPWAWLSNPKARICAAVLFVIAIVVEWRTWIILACGCIIATFFYLASIK